MSSTADSDLVSLVSTLIRLESTNVSMLAFVVYDAILTLHGESQIVWKELKTKVSPQLVLYFICKYGAVLDATILACQFHKLITPSRGKEHREVRIFVWFDMRRCIALYIPMMVLVLCLEASGHCNTLISILFLCNRNVKIKRIMIFVTTISYAVACAFLIRYMGPSVRSTVTIQIQNVRSCVTEFDARVAIGLWGPPVLVDVCAIVLLCWNALDQPRTSNIRIASILAHDGIALLLSIDSSSQMGFALRLAVIILSIISDQGLNLVTALYIEYINASFNTRLFLMLRGRSVLHSPDSDFDDHEDFDSLNSVHSEISTGIHLIRMPHSGEQI
ncbi:hypothetical protein SCHPADRAFT_945227 [Schizopora paradoxa]|uniref:DUF6533 domain-containing protein n=1 Tax=Schizopora paradoxa TaxID=27342 RepID=A0A0H2RDD5_9AGAM|nr:hypothetical protein SCHPADRAFT_945227 [Schizopora paradoxa]